MGSHRSRGKKGNDIGLHMECYEDELSPAQLAAYNKVKNDFAEFTTRIESLIKNNNVDVAEKSEGVVLLQVNRYHSLFFSFINKDNNLSVYIIIKYIIIVGLTENVLTNVVVCSNHFYGLDFIENHREGTRSI